MKSTQTKNLVTSILSKADIRIDGNRPGDIKVNDDRFYSRLMLGGSLALGETYMDGMWDCDDIGEMMRKILSNGIKPPIDLKAAMIYVGSMLGNLQTIRGSKQVANVHYNLPSEMYMQFLGPLNQYTSFYYANTKNDVKAEEARLDLICRKLKLTKNDRVLDIGCGWGGFAKYAAEKYGCRVTGVSIAKEQIAHAKKITKGLPVKFIISDYRDLKGSFDKIFSGGMLEHVGYKNYRTYMKKIAELLNDDGLALIDCIGGVIPVKGPDPWVGKYIFPNSMIATPSQLGQAFEKLLVLEDWHNFRNDYAQTIRYWERNFKRNWKKIRQLDPDMFNERFYRMWIYYLEIFIGTFESSFLQQWQIVLSKPNNASVYRSVR